MMHISKRIFLNTIKIVLYPPYTCKTLVFRHDYRVWALSKKWFQRCTFLMIVSLNFGSGRLMCPWWKGSVLTDNSNIGWEAGGCFCHPLVQSNAIFGTLTNLNSSQWQLQGIWLSCSSAIISLIKELSSESWSLAPSRGSNCLWVSWCYVRTKIRGKRVIILNLEIPASPR